MDVTDFTRRNRDLLGRFPRAFLEDVVQALALVYTETFDGTSELPLANARYLRPHQLRTFAEMAFLRIARRHGVNASTGYNRNGDAHNLVASPPYVGTLSRLQHPRALPRRAAFRWMYANYVSMAQFPMPGMIEREAPIQIDERRTPAYIIFGHGSQVPHAREVGFIVVNFMGRDGRYLGAPIDLMREFRAVTAPVSQEIVDDSLAVRPRSLPRVRNAGQK